MTARLRMRFLGGFRLEEGETAIKTEHLPRLQSFLAYLLLHRNVLVSRQQVAFLFWPDSTDGQARANLRKLLFRCRKRLPQFDDLFETAGQTLRWRREAPIWVDVAEFERLLGQAKQAQQRGEQRAQREALDSAVALYGGDLWPDCYEDWILPRREGLRERFIRALEELLLLSEGERDYAEAIRYAQRLLRVDELREESYRALMRLHAANGQSGAALRVYHTCVTVLEDELGVAPSSATRHAYERLLNIQPNASLPPLRQASFVERHTEWAQLQAAWQEALRGESKVVLITGEAGLGKTRLAEEFVRWVKRQGFRTASAHCYATAGELVYLPVAAWLRTMLHEGHLSTLPDLWLTEVARLLPELLIQRPDLPPPTTLKQAWQRQAFYQALRIAILIDQPTLLLLDDLQWCDSETCAWLPYLLRFNPRSQLLLVATMRRTEMTAQQESFLLGMRRTTQLTEIALCSLNSSESAALASKTAGRPLSEALTARLYDESEGNPLFIVETVHSMSSHQGATIGVGTLPHQVATVIEYRLAQLTTQGRELAGLCAVIGRAFTFELLREVSQDAEEILVQRLDELWQKRLIRSQNEENEEYDFTHDKIRTVALSKLSPIRRRFLHRKVALALERLHEGNLETVAGQIASHYEAAAKKQQAIPYYQQAAQAAIRIYANQEALSYLNRMLTLLTEQATRAGAEALSKNQRLQSWAFFHRSEIHFRLSQIDACQQDLHLTADLAALQADKDLLAYVRYREAKLHFGAGRRAEAHQSALESIRLSQEVGNRQREAKCHCLLAEMIRAKGQYQQATETFERMLALFRELGDVLSEIHTLCNLSTLNYYMQNYQLSIELARQALKRCEEANLPFRRRIPLGDMGVAAYALQEFDNARQYLSQSLAIGEQVDDHVQKVYSLVYLGRLAVQEEQPETALTHLQAALNVIHENGLQGILSLVESSFAEAYHLASKDEQAMQHAHHALRLAQARGHLFYLSQAQKVLAKLER